MVWTGRPLLWLSRPALQNYYFYHDVLDSEDYGLSETLPDGAIVLARVNATGDGFTDTRVVGLEIDTENAQLKLVGDNSDVDAIKIVIPSVSLDANNALTLANGQVVYTWMDTDGSWMVAVAAAIPSETSSAAGPRFLIGSVDNAGAFTVADGITGLDASAYDMNANTLNLPALTLTDMVVSFSRIESFTELEAPETEVKAILIQRAGR